MYKKRIIVCCDGTWNLPDQMDEGVFSPTNVVKMARAIKPVDSNEVEQVVFYDKGVGADQWGLDKFAAGGMGMGLDNNIIDAYRFLIHNYDKGDEIFFFGFSRGSYTARSTVGLISNSGLLKKEYADKIWYAYKIYKEAEDVGSEHIEQIKQSFSREIEIKFIGVWDTVGSLGIPDLEEGRNEEEELGYADILDFVLDKFRSTTKKHYEFHNVKISEIVKNAYHALAIDERRKAFSPSLWENEGDNQIVEQVWFPGVHSDVGGGYKKHDLSDLAFMWMKEKAEKCGLEFNDEYIESNINPDETGKIHESKTGIFEKFDDYIRPIGESGVNEFIHPLAKERFENPNIDYEPDNLKEALENEKCPVLDI